MQIVLPGSAESDPSKRDTPTVVQYLLTVQYLALKVANRDGTWLMKFSSIYGLVFPDISVRVLDKMECRCRSSLVFLYWCTSDSKYMYFRT